MEVIVREVNLAYTSIKNGEGKSYDPAVFAEEHIHSVLDLVSNKDVTESLCKLQGSFKDAVKEDPCKDDTFSIIKGSDIKQEDLFVNKELVDQLVKAIEATMNNKETFSYILQYGVSGNHQKETVKIAASQLNLPVMVIHREDVITRFSKDCEPRVKAMFQKCRDYQTPIILYIENLDGIISSIHASPNELMKRRVVEKELCKQLAQLTPADNVIVIMNSEAPFALKNELQNLQGERLYYSFPDDDQRRSLISSLLSCYDNDLSEYCLQRLFIHSSCCSIQQIRTLFDQLYLCMLICKYNQMDPQDFDLESVPKAQQYPVIVSFCDDKMNGKEISVPNISDALLFHFLEKMKPAFSVVDTSRVLDWCHSLSVPSEVTSALDGMIVLLRERDEMIRKQDLQNTASKEPIERRSGEKYEMPTIQTTVTEQPTHQPSSPRGTNALSSSKFCRMMSAETLNTAAAGDQFRQEMEQKKKEEAERLKMAEQRNLEERERMRREEEKRQQDEEERRKAEFEAQKRKEEERQRRIEAKLAAQEAERNRKIEEQRRKNEEAARRRQEEAERREAERHQREQEELERREAERLALAEKRRQREQEERKKKEAQNRKEAEEQNRRYQEERRRIYEASMDFSAEAYRASTARLDEKKSAEQLALERDQKKREDAIKKARELALEKLNQEKEQKKMEKQVYERLAALRRPAPENEEEKFQRVEEAKKVIVNGKERLAVLKKLQEEVKAMVMEKRKREEEERKKKEEEERKKRKEEERKRKEEEERIEKEKREEEERKKKQREAEAEKRRQELEKEKEERRLKKQAEARKMEERLLEDELKLLDAREKLYSLRKLLKEVKGRLYVC